jgi:hypothetical protein
MVAGKGATHLLSASHLRALKRIEQWGETAVRCKLGSGHKPLAGRDRCQPWHLSYNDGTQGKREKETLRLLVQLFSSAFCLGV